MDDQLEERRRLIFDTRTELDIILGFVDLIGEDPGSQPEMLHDLESVRRCSLNIRELVARMEGFLDEAQQRTLEPTRHPGDPPGDG